MSDSSKIEWTDATWNPVTGCTKVSPGCDHCYAERVTERFHGKGSFATVTLHPERLDVPLRWRRPPLLTVDRQPWPCDARSATERGEPDDS